MKLCVVTLLAVALVGCAGRRVWYQEGKTQAEAERAIAECRYEASKIVYPGNPLIEIDKQGDVFRQCMSLKGYRLVDAKSLQ